ncbi:AraC family transcriptional regulator [Acinetobacter tandoii]|uniref:AraC family transcriptional regulator n=1 Tax=Acinetobacter tandoii TaxID=202954 RepID=UPI003D6A83D1
MLNRLQLSNDASKAQTEFWSDPNMPYVETRKACHSRACYHAHSHPTFSIGAVDVGQSVFSSHFVGTQKIESGTLVLIPANVEHSCNPEPDQAWSYQMMHLDMLWLRQLLHETKQDFRCDAVPQYKPQLYQSERLYSDFCYLNQSLFDSSISYLQKEQLLIQTLTELLFPNLHLELLSENSYAQQEFHLLLFRLGASDEFLTLEQLSKQSGLSRYAIIRLFKSNLGLTPHAYQLNLKINQARMLLRQGKDIIELSYQLGFSDQSHFQRVFKQLTGTTPKFYQKQHRRAILYNN